MTPLRRRLIEELNLRGHTERTITTYVGVVARLAQFHHTSPDRLSDEQIRSYILTFAASHAPASVTQLLSALRFFYQEVLGRRCAALTVARPKHEHKLPVVLSSAEVARVLAEVTVPAYRVCLTAIYGCGLRLLEHLREQERVGEWPCPRSRRSAQEADGPAVLRSPDTVGRLGAIFESSISSVLWRKASLVHILVVGSAAGAPTTPRLKVPALPARPVGWLPAADRVQRRYLSRLRVPGISKAFGSETHSCEVRCTYSHESRSALWSLSLRRVARRGAAQVRVTSQARLRRPH